MMLQETKNPITGEWELMTPRQWWLIKLGLGKDAQVDDWTLAILKGPEHAVAYAFKKYQFTNPGANAWLVKRYKEWFPRTPNSRAFAEWCYFMVDHYNLDNILPIMDEAYQIKIGLLRHTIDSLKLTKSIKDKQDAYYARKMNDSRRGR